MSKGIMVTVSNDYHLTQARVRINGEKVNATTISKSVANRIRKALCGVAGCSCGNVIGMRGRQDIEASEMPDGKVMLRRYDTMI